MNATQTNVKDTAGTLRTCNQYPQIAANAGIDTRGLVIGTGATAVDIADFKLETKIAHGTAATQIKYEAVVFEAFAVVGSTASFVVKRRFENASGATITVSEAGIYIFDSVYYFLGARDVLATPQDVLNGQILELKYTFKTTV